MNIAHALTIAFLVSTVVILVCGNRLAPLVIFTIGITLLLVSLGLHLANVSSGAYQVRESAQAESDGR